MKFCTASFAGEGEEPPRARPLTTPPHTPLTTTGETGNEIDPPAAWTERIAAFIKALAPNHLVLSGKNGVDPAQATPHVDMLSSHFYPMSLEKLNADANLAASVNRVYIAGEYGWNQGPSPSAFLAAAEANENVTGDAFWSLFPHADSHGFVQHGDGFTVHFPGDAPSMASFIDTARHHAAAMLGLPSPPSLPAPLAPAITTLSTAGGLAWRGGALGSTYAVRFSPLNAGGPWQPLCACGSNCDATCLTDNDTPVANISQIPLNSYVMVAGVGLDGQAGPWSDAAQLLE